MINCFDSFVHGPNGKICRRVKKTSKLTIIPIRFWRVAFCFTIHRNVHQRSSISIRSNMAETVSTMTNQGRNGFFLSHFPLAISKLCTWMHIFLSFYTGLN